MASHKRSLACLLSLMLGLTLTLAFVPTWAFATGDTEEEPVEELASTDPVDQGDAEVVDPADAVDATEDGDAADDEEKKADEVDVVAPAPADEQPATTDETPKQDEPAATPDVQPEDTATVGVTYRAHVQDRGWLAYVKDGAMGGTQGSSLRMEALNISLQKSGAAPAGGIEYRVHVQDKGWLGWVRDGKDGGTTGQSKRLEAIQIRLYGDVAKDYDVYYSVHAQNKGWMAWTANGATAGTASQALRLEAIRIKIVKHGEAGPGTQGVQYSRAFDGGSVISVSAHVQDIGWQRAVGNGAVAGTTGKGKRMEALRMNVGGLDIPGGVELSGHVQDIGWMGWANGSTGTTGRGKRLEAVKIRLTGEAASKYHVYYRVHVANLGWMGWAKDGEEAGTSGMSNRIEAIQVKVLANGAAAPTEKGNVSERFLTGTTIRYNASCETYGWRGEVANGSVAGTTGAGKRLEAFTVRLDGGTIGGGVNYSSYVTGSGWQATKSNNDVSGTTGQSKAVQAIRVSLSGRAATMYNVYYRVHMQDAGWLGWAVNGQTAGAPGVGKRVEAIQIRLVGKLSGAPGSGANHEVNKAFFDDSMTKKAQGYSSPTGWLILVDTDHTQLAVFTGSRGNWRKYDQWVVSVGAWNTPSKRGVFSVGSRGYSFGHGYTCYYWTEWSGPYLFHSIKYNEGTFDVQDGTLGGHVSMGCVRMPIERAKWIYDNMPTGTTVVVY